MSELNSEQRATAGFLAAIAWTIQDFDAPDRGAFVRRRFVQVLNEKLDMVASTKQLSESDRLALVELRDQLVKLVDYQP